MKRLATIVLGFLLCTSTIADNTLLVGNIGMSGIVDQIGGAAITIPIEVPAGVKGMQPNLSLVYNSHRGYGLAGWGWDLAGISSIQRTGKTFYHDNTIDGIRRDNTDNLLLDGERLLLKSGSNLCENSTYRTEHESFSLITMDDYQGFTVNNSDTLSITYDATTGNIISKSDLGASSEFTYDDSSKPHALRGVSGITSDWGGTDMSIRYTDFGKAQLIQRGDDSYSIVYGSSKERFITREDVSDVITTRYYMPTYEIVTNSNGKEDYIIYLRNGSIVVYDKTSDTYALYHGYYDAQGSLVALTDNSGNVIARYAYDPWGCRVSPTDWTQSTTAPDVLGINRGYTMHEHLDEFELINMNGRVYDPAVAQFLSPDPYIQDAGNWLNYNRYAYCYNNPTRYVDPSGEVAVTAFLLGMVASAAIDYGMQVAFNHWLGYKGKDAWVNNVDFFDIAVSGAIGGFTAGYGASLKAGESIGRFGSWFVNNTKTVKLGELVLTSAVDITEKGFQNVESETFSSRMLIGGMTWAASDIISGMFSQNRLSNESQNVTKHSKTEVRTTPNNLSEQLALEEAKSGMGISIMDKRLKDPSRIGWLKMSHVHRGLDGRKIEIHYWFDPRTGIREGFKFK